MENKALYEAPTVEFLTARVEKGFDVSGSQQPEGLSTQQMEGGTSEHQWN